MKKYLVLLIAILLVFSCKEKEKKEIETLKQQVEALRNDNQMKDSVINQFFRVLNEIEENLIVIKEKENTISKNAALGAEMQSDVRERINEDIQFINELMTQNKKSIRSLAKQVKDSDFKVEGLEQRIEQTSRLLSERDSQIELLKESLANLNFSLEVLNATIDTLNVEKELLAKEVESKIDLLNMAWYAYGTKRELVDNGVVEKTGGFIGIGKTLKLKPDFNENYFTKIDVTKTPSIPLFAKKARLVTSHPSESFQLVLNESNIIEKIDIVDAESFWSASKYLVIVVD
ncbi:MAG TPA: hypothetical protein PL017_03400 [Tenuifilaceae bacterium]|nr:hypothetical protein [Tenuifilaceae bacterium]HPE18897.1 hypothetical protein [Tenuifilaceae bacterium]HPJ45118.1 hypothetical protein [Tenuifilaceae bacterium]HPQ33718.1 hypothetical protein [Tenuifilaceae bacterium]